MKHPSFSLLLTIGLMFAGSTALGYYYLFSYAPPLAAAEAFMHAMETRNAAAIKHLIVVKDASENLREPETKDLDALLDFAFKRGRVVDQRRVGDDHRDYYYLSYREPDGQMYTMVVTTVFGQFRVIVPERPDVPPTPPYLIPFS